MAQKPRSNRWSGWLKRKPSILRPFPSAGLRFEELEVRTVPTTFTWTGGYALANPLDVNRLDWSIGGNWSGGVAPTGTPAPAGQEGDLLVFPDAPPPSVRVTTNDILITPTSGTFDSITFSTNTGSYTLNGNPINLGRPGVPNTGTIVVGAGSLGNVINFQTNLAAGPSNGFIKVGTGGSLTISGSIVGNSSANITKQQAGTLTLTADNSSFLGTIAVDPSAGILAISNPHALGSSTIGTTVGSNSTLQLLTGAGTVNEPLLLNGSGFDANGALFNVSGNNTWAGNISLSSSSSEGVAIGASGAGATPANPSGTVLNITGSIGDAAGSLNLSKEGTGEVQFNGHNTFAGQMFVNSGILTVGTADALGQGGSDLSGTIVNSTVFEQGQLRLEANTGGDFTILNEFLTLNGQGQSSLNAPPAGITAVPGSLTNFGANNTWAGPVILGSPPPNGDTRSANLIDIMMGTGKGTLTISGVISSPNHHFALVAPFTPFSLTKVDTGELIFNNANTYNGPTFINAGTLDIRDSQSLGTGAVTVFNGATLQLDVEAGIGGTGVSEVDAHGRNLSDDSVTHDAHRLTISNVLSLNGFGVNRVGALYSATGINIWTSTITISTAAIGVDLDPRPGHPSADSSYFVNDYSLTTTNTIGGGELHKVDAGQLILPVANTYTGKTYIEKGWVTVQNNLSLGAIVPLTTQTRQPETYVLNGAALHLRTLTPASPPLTIAENLIISGIGPLLPYKFISQKGALMSIGGDNIIGQDSLVAPTWFGYLALNGQAGIGVEQVEAGASSSLTEVGMMKDDNITNPATPVPGGIIKFGSKQLTLEGDGTYTLANDVREGAISVRNDTALGLNSSGTASTQEAYTQTNTTVESGANVRLDQSIDILNGGVASGLQVTNEQLTLNSAGQQIAVAGNLVKAPSQFFLSFPGVAGATGTGLVSPSYTTTAMIPGLTAVEMGNLINQLPSIKGSEIQSVKVNSTGNFTLNYNGQTTPVRAAGATAAVVQADLLALTSIQRPEVQLLNIAGAAGTFTLSFNGVTTAVPLTLPTSAAAIQGALNGLSTIAAAGGVTVTNPSGTQYQIAFTAVGNQPSITGVGALGATVTQIQTINVTGAGTLSLSYKGVSTLVPLTLPATASQVQIALNGLTTITAEGGVTVGLVGTTYTVTFNLMGNHQQITATTTGAAVATVAGVDGLAGTVSVSSALVGTSTVYTINYGGDFSFLNLNPIVAAGTAISAGAVTTIRDGVNASVTVSANEPAGGGNLYTIAFQGDLAGQVLPAFLATTAPNDGTLPAVGALGNNQTVSVVAADGTFTLTYTSPSDPLKSTHPGATATTNPIPITALAVQVQNELNSLQILKDDVGSVTVNRAGNVYTVIFGSSHSTDVPLLVATPIFAPLGTPEVTVSGATNIVDFTGADLTVSATNPLQVTSASHVFTSDDAFRVLQVTGGSGWIVGSYTIQSVANGVATLSSQPAAMGATGGSYSIGYASEASIVSLADDNAWRGPIMLNDDGRVATTANTRINFFGTIGDANNTNDLLNGSDFVKRGYGEVVLAAGNTYRGTTYIDEGILTVANSVALGDTRNGTIVSNKAQIQIQGSLTIAGEPLTLEGQGVPSASTMSDQWFNVGAASTNMAPTASGQPVSARITSVATDPQDPNVIYVATAGGGAWKSKNHGVTWVQLFDDTFDASAVMYGGSILVAPSDPNTVYFATGEANGGPNGSPVTGQQDDFAGTGVYISRNAGATWTLVTGPGQNNPLFGLAVTKMIIDPTQPLRIYVATANANVIGGGVDPIANNLTATAVAGVYRYDGSAATPDWINLTGLPSNNRKNTFSTNAPFDTTLPNDAGPDDDYRIEFPQTNAAWSDIALVREGPGQGANPGNTINGNTWVLYAALGDSQQRYYTGANSQGIFNAVYRTEDPANTFPAGTGPTWWIGNGTIYPVAAPSSSEVPTSTAIPAPTLPDQRPTTTYYVIGRETDPVPPPTSNPHAAGRNEWIKITAVVTRYYNDPPAVYPTTNMNASIRVYATELGNSVDNWSYHDLGFSNPFPNHVGEFLDMQESGWDGGVGATSWTAGIHGPNPIANSPTGDPFGDNTTGVALGRYDSVLISADQTYGFATTAAVASTLYLAGKTDIWMTTNAIGGTPTWTLVTGTANDPADYYHSLFIDHSTGTLLSGSDGGVWSNSGGKFSNLNGNLNITQLNAADPNPSDFNVALAASYNNGLQLFNYNNTGLASTVPNVPGAGGDRARDTGSVSYDPKNPQIAFASVGGFLYRSTDGGANWTLIMGASGSNSFPVYVDPLNPSRVLIGGSAVEETTQSGVSAATLPSTFINLNGGSAIAIAPAVYQGTFVADPGFPLVLDRLANTPDPSTIYVTDGSTVQVTKNHGDTWIGRSPFNDIAFTVDFGGSLANTNIQQMTTPPGTAGISIRTQQQGGATGDEIQSIEIVAPTGGSGTFKIRIRIPGFGPGPGTTQTTGPIPYGATSADIQTAINALNGMINGAIPGSGSVTVTPAPQLISNTITDIAVDPSNRDTVYVTSRSLTNSAASTVFRSTDAGQTWTDITGNLPLVQTWTVIVDPRTDTLYIGNDQGVFQLTNGSQTQTFNWTRFGAGMPEVQVHDLVLNQTLNTLTASTYGRGLFQLLLTDYQANSGAIRVVSGSSIWTGPVTLVGDTTMTADGTQKIQNGYAAAQLEILGPISSPVKFVATTIPGTVSSPETQTVEVAASSGFFVLSFNGQSTAPIPVGATAQMVEDALNALSNIASVGSVVVSQNAIPSDITYTISFLANGGQHQITSGVVTKSGLGTIIFSGSNTYGGQTLVQQGVLVSNNPTALGASSPTQNTIVAAGAALGFESSLKDEPVLVNGDGISFNGHFTGALHNITNQNVYTGHLTLGTNTTIGVEPGTTLTIGADPTSLLTGTGFIDDQGNNFTLDKELGGTLVLSSANTLGGTTTVDQGALRVEDALALGNPTAPGDPAAPFSGTIVRDGAQIELSRKRTVATAALIVETQAGGPPGTPEIQTLTAPASGAYILGFLGSVTPSLDANSTAAQVQAALNLLASIGGSGGSVVVAGTYPTFTITFGGSLANLNVALITSSVVTYTPTIVKYEQLTLSGTGINVTGALRNVRGDLDTPGTNDNTWQGPITFASVPNVFPSTTPGSRVAIGVDDSGVAGVTDNLNIDTNIQQDSNITSYGLIKVGAGRLNLLQANSYTGTTEVGVTIGGLNFVGGTLRIENPNSLGPNANSNSVQTLNVVGTTPSLTYNLSYLGQSTASTTATGSLSATATAAQVQAALNALPSIGISEQQQITVVGAGGTLSFAGSLPVTPATNSATDIQNALNSLTTIRRNEQQDIQVSGNSGFFTLTFTDDTTVPLAYNVPASGGAGAAASVQNALNALPSIGANGVTVTATATAGVTTYHVLFNGATTGFTNQPQIVASPSPVFTNQDGSGSVNEVQTLSVFSTTGTYILTFNGLTTTPIPFNATAQQVQDALNAVPSIGGIGGSVTVTGAYPTYTITFGGALANTDVPEIIATGAGGPVVAVATVTQGLGGFVTVSNSLLVTFGGDLANRDVPQIVPNSGYTVTPVTEGSGVLVTETPSVNGKLLTVTFLNTLANPVVPQITAVNVSPSLAVNIATVQQGGAGAIVNNAAGASTLEIDGDPTGIGGGTGINVAKVLAINGPGVLNAAGATTGALNSVSGIDTYSGAITLSTDSSIGANLGTTLTVPTLQDPTPLTVPAPVFTKVGTGTVVFPNANAYGGQTIVRDGVLSTNNPQGLGTGRTEVQTFSTVGNIGGFALTYNGQTTVPLLFNVPASGGANPNSSVQNALNALSSVQRPEIQTVDVTTPGGAIAGNFTLIFEGLSATIPVGSSAATVQSLLNAALQPTFGANATSVSAIAITNGMHYTITYIGTNPGAVLLNNDLPLITASGMVSPSVTATANHLQDGLNGFVTVTSVGIPGSQSGSNEPGRQYTVTFGGSLANSNLPLIVSNSGMVLTNTVTDGSAAAPEVQLAESFVKTFNATDLTFTGSSPAVGPTKFFVTSATHFFVAGDVGSIIQVTGGAGWTLGSYTIASVVNGVATLTSQPATAVGTSGGHYTFMQTFALSFNGSTTTALNAGASAATVQTALLALNSIRHNEVQVVRVTGTSGTWNLTVPANNLNGTLHPAQTLSNLAFNIPAATLQTMLQGLSNVGAGHVSVTSVSPVGSGYTEYTITFLGAPPAGLGFTNLGTVVLSGNNDGATPTINTSLSIDGLGGTVQVQINPPSPAGDVVYQITFGGDLATTNVNLITGSSATTTASFIGSSTAVDGNGSETQYVNVTGSTGTFQLTFNGKSTNPLFYNASAADVEDELNRLVSINGGIHGYVSVTLAGTPGGAGGATYTVNFEGSLADQNLPIMTKSTTPGVVVNITTGNDGPEGTTVLSGATLQLVGNMVMDREAVTLNGQGYLNQGALKIGDGVTPSNVTWQPYIFTGTTPIPTTPPVQQVPLFLGSDASIGTTLAADTLTFLVPISDQGNTRALDIYGPGTVNYAGTGTGTFGGTAYTMYTGQTTVHSGLLNLSQVITGTDLTLVAASQVKSTTHPFTAADVNSFIKINGGGGWTGSTYTIMSVSAGVATLSAPPATIVGTSGGVYTLTVASILGNLIVGDGIGGQPPAAGGATVRETVDSQIADTKSVTVNSDGLFDLNGLTDKVGSLTVLGGTVKTEDSGHLTTAAINMTGGTIAIGNSASVAAASITMGSSASIVGGNNSTLTAGTPAGTGFLMMDNSQITFGNAGFLDVGPATLTNGSLISFQLNGVMDAGDVTSTNSAISFGNFGTATVNTLTLNNTTATLSNSSFTMGNQSSLTTTAASGTTLKATNSIINFGTGDNTLVNLDVGDTVFIGSAVTFKDGSVLTTGKLDMTGGTMNIGTEVSGGSTSLTASGAVTDTAGTIAFGDTGTFTAPSLTVLNNGAIAGMITFQNTGDLELGAGKLSLTGSTLSFLNFGTVNSGDVSAVANSVISFLLNGALNVAKLVLDTSSLSMGDHAVSNALSYLATNSSMTFGDSAKVTTTSPPAPGTLTLAGSDFTMGKSFNLAVAGTTMTAITIPGSPPVVRASTITLGNGSTAADSPNTAELGVVNVAGDGASATRGSVHVGGFSAVHATSVVSNLTNFKFDTTDSFIVDGAVSATNSNIAFDTDAQVSFGDSGTGDLTLVNSLVSLAGPNAGLPEIDTQNIFLTGSEIQLATGDTLVPNGNIRAYPGAQSSLQGGTVNLGSVVRTIFVDPGTSYDNLLVSSKLTTTALSVIKGGVTASDLKVVGSSNVVTSAAHPFTQADKGSIVQVTGGTGWTVGNYTIVSVSGGAATLSAQPATLTNATGGSYLFGAGRLEFAPTAPIGTSLSVPLQVQAGDVQVDLNAKIGTVDLLSSNSSLSGNGTVGAIQGATAATAATGSVNPGTNDPAGSVTGILNASSIRWGATTTFFVNLTHPTTPVVAGTNYDKLVVTGAAVLGGAKLDGTFDAAGASIPGLIVPTPDTFTILHAAGGITGRFAEPFGENPDGSGIVYIGGHKFDVSYLPSSGTVTDVVLTKDLASVSTAANPMTVTTTPLTTSTLKQSILATATMHPEPGAGNIPTTDTVTFTFTSATATYHGTIPVGTGTANPNQAVFDTSWSNTPANNPSFGLFDSSNNSVPFLPAGTYTISATFNSDNIDFNTASASAPSITVVKPVFHLPSGLTYSPPAPPLPGLVSNYAAISPNGDGVQDQLNLTGTIDQERGNYSWTITITGSAGTLTTPAVNVPAGGPTAIFNPVWNGQISAGNVVPGDYSIFATFNDQYGNTDTSNTISVVVDNVPPSTPILSQTHQLIAPQTPALSSINSTLISGVVSDPSVGGSAHPNGTLDHWSMAITNSSGATIRTFNSIAGTDLTVDVANPLMVTSAHNFTNADIGSTLDVMAGTGWTKGSYTITNVVGNAAILNNPPATLVGAAGGSYVVASVNTTWDGTDAGGVNRVPDGVYTATLKVYDAAGNVSAPATQKIVVLTTQPKVVESSNSPSIYGDTITLKATVRMPANLVNPPQSVIDLLAGTQVQFLKGATVLASVPVSPATLVQDPTDPTQYTVSVQVPTFNAGTYSDLKVHFLGSSNFLPGDSALYTQVVNPKAITVTASSSVTKVYGDPVPPLTFASGVLSVAPGALVNGDTPASVFSGAVTTTATASSPVIPAGYPITNASPSNPLSVVVPPGGTIPNYTFTFVNGLITVTKRNLTIVIGDQTRSLHQANPTNIPGTDFAPASAFITAPGLLFGDPTSVITGYTLTTPATVNSHVGKYPITVAGTPTSQNYNINGIIGQTDPTHGILSIIPIPTGVVVGPGEGGGPIANIYSPTGQYQSTINAFDAGFTGGVRTATGDFNRDGILDYAVGTGPGVLAEVRVIDGATGNVIFDVNPLDGFEGGVFVAAGDINGDGADDLVITPDLGGGPRVVVYSGIDFSPMISYFGINDPNFRGGARAGVGDMNGDGYADIAVSAGFQGGPRISIWDGKSLANAQFTNIVPDFYAFDPSLRNGAYVAIGDVNGDGFGDLIAGAGPGGGPQVKIFSGADLMNPAIGPANAVPFANFFAGNPANRGGVRVAAKSLDSDLQADVVTGVGEGGGSTVTAYLGSKLATGDYDPYFGVDAFPGFVNGVYVG